MAMHCSFSRLSTEGSCDDGTVGIVRDAGHRMVLGQQLLLSWWTDKAPTERSTKCNHA